LPFAEQRLIEDPRDIKKTQASSETREEILSMIWDVDRKYK